ncbi:MAG: type III pantothenate kinase [candidate division KSB1 bacterium]|nr:type III pantothenate kinase [candidate division KSB1 bacterium]
MLLAIDIGNTQIAAGLMEGDELRAHWRISSMIERTEDEAWMMMSNIARANQVDLAQTTGVVISSVVPDLTHTFEKMAVKYLHFAPLVVSSALDLGIEIAYESPTLVGADRLCNAVGGFFKYGGPLNIVDFGTATTFDVVSRDGKYLGGVIAPGIEMSAQILHRRAAKLPRVYLSFPARVIGRTTETSMQSGLMYGTVEMVEGLTARISEELGEKPMNIATGGLARLLMGHLRTPFKLEPFLTLEGMRIIYERNRP